MEILTHFEQRSDEWRKARNGRITMSRAKDLLTGGKGVTRASYLREVAAEILAGASLQGGYQSNDMIRGVELEPFALRAYEAMTGEKVQPVGFVIGDDPRIGGSPDALTEAGGVEIKSPLPKHHLRYADRATVEKEHGPQFQGYMWLCEREYWDFVSFCPWVKARPLIRHQFYRDEKIIKDLACSAIQGADEIAAIVNAIECADSLPEKVRAITDEAAKYWDSFQDAYESEVKIRE